MIVVVKVFVITNWDYVDVSMDLLVSTLLVYFLYIYFAWMRITFIDG